MGLREPRQLAPVGVATLLKIAQDLRVRVIRADHCRFGRMWKKRSRFLCGNIEQDDVGVWSMCARDHVVSAVTTVAIDTFSFRALRRPESSAHE